MTQQNAALVEETASASEEMANQAQELLAMTQQFKIREASTTKINRIEHKEIHLKNAEKKTMSNQAETKKINNGASDTASPSKQSGFSPEKNGMKELMKEEGFEEF